MYGPKAFCGEPDTTTSQVTDSCRTEVTGFSEGSINVFFLIIRTQLKQFLLGVAQLLVGFIYTFWFFLSFITSLLKSGHNKKDQKKISAAPFFKPFFSAASCRKGFKKWCSQKIYRTFLFCDSFRMTFFCGSCSLALKYHFFQ